MYVSMVTLPLAGLLAIITLFVNKIPQGYETLINHEIPELEQKV